MTTWEPVITVIDIPIELPKKPEEKDIPEKEPVKEGNWNG